MKDPRQASNGTKYSLSDTLLGAFSLFFMQSASLFDGLKNKRAVNFQTYVRKHRQRIPGYEYYQWLGIPIGLGDVESKIKQIGNRVKLSGARWKRDHVPPILRLRCAYLNRSHLLSIYTHS